MQLSHIEDHIAAILTVLLKCNTMFSIKSSSVDMLICRCFDWSEHPNWLQIVHNVYALDGLKIYTFHTVLNETYHMHFEFSLRFVKWIKMTSIQPSRLQWNITAQSQQACIEYQTTFQYCLINLIPRQLYANALLQFGFGSLCVLLPAIPNWKNGKFLRIFYFLALSLSHTLQYSYLKWSAFVCFFYSSA